MKENESIQAEIDQTARAISDGVQRLGDLVKEKAQGLSLTQAISARPALAITGAVVSGVIVGTVVGKQLQDRNSALYRIGEPLVKELLAAAILRLTRPS